MAPPFLPIGVEVLFGMPLPYFHLPIFRVYRFGDSISLSICPDFQTPPQQMDNINKNQTDWTKKAKRTALGIHVGSLSQIQLQRRKIKRKGGEITNRKGL